MADCGFKIENELTLRQCYLNLPPKRNKQGSLSALDIERTVQLRTRVERCIEQARNFEVLNKVKTITKRGPLYIINYSIIRVISLSMANVQDDIEAVYLYLTNFSIPLVSD